ncbi:LysR family transcriptional regulator [Novosphingobium bradum]|uniref:LysR family transcriptional regulator n=1 Tax=Novosphingobium bradum TaxID=1737444 RepID=A0ABV7INU2_9SPHN
MDDLRKLRHAVTLAAEGSFARASKALNLTQPALSRSIRALEDSLGMVLFERHGTGIRLTASGAAFVERAQLLLSHATSLAREARDMRDGRSGRLSAGVDPMLAPLLEPWLSEAARSGGAIQLHIYVQPIRRLLEMLLEQQIDFFIGDTGMALHVEGLRTTSLAVMSASYYVRAGHPLLALPNVQVQDLLAFPHASLDARDVNRGLDLPGSIHRAVIVCDDVRALKAATLASDAVLLGTRLGLEPELSAGLLVPVPLALTRNWISHLGAIELQGRERSGLANQLIARFQALLSEVH